jgi:Tfp pilus assembly protein PilN
VSSGAWLEIDLLRQRRERVGVQRPAFIPVRTLLLRGAMLGAVLPLLLMLTCVWLWFRESNLHGRATALQPLADEHDRLELEIQSEKLALQAAVETNQAMAAAMADVSSSSALLAELRRLVPVSISFDQLRVNGGSLDLNGEAQEPNGLRTVNALMLSLAQSPLFVVDQVRLSRAATAGGQSANGAERVSYALTARFAADAPQAIRPQLTALGAIGLERRLARLQQEEGLLP